jgi:hypothetical protein
MFATPRFSWVLAVQRISTYIKFTTNILDIDCRVGAKSLELRWRSTERQPSSAEFPIHKYKCIARRDGANMYFLSAADGDSDNSCSYCPPTFIKPFIYKKISQPSVLFKRALQLCYRTECVNSSSVIDSDRCRT